MDKQQELFTAVTEDEMRLIQSMRDYLGVPFIAAITSWQKDKLYKLMAEFRSQPDHKTIQ